MKAIGVVTFAFFLGLGFLYNTLNSVYSNAALLSPYSQSVAGITKFLLSELFIPSRPKIRNTSVPIVYFPGIFGKTPGLNDLPLKGVYEFLGRHSSRVFVIPNPWSDAYKGHINLGNLDIESDLMVRQLQKLKVESFILYGESYGARLALRVARKLKSKVKKVILISPPGRLDTVFSNLIRIQAQLPQLKRRCFRVKTLKVLFGDYRAVNDCASYLFYSQTFQKGLMLSGRKLPRQIPEDPILWPRLLSELRASGVVVRVFDASNDPLGGLGRRYTTDLAPLGGHMGVLGNSELRTELSEFLTSEVGH